jgi:hypothetical protein
VLYKSVDSYNASSHPTYNDLPVYWYTKKTEFFEPELVVNLAGNTDFTSTAGW